MIIFGGILIFAFIFFVLFTIFLLFFDDGFGFFCKEDDIKAHSKFIEISFDSFLILKEALKNNENKEIIIKEKEFPVLEIYEKNKNLNSYFSFYSYETYKVKKVIILFPTFKDCVRYSYWLPSYLDEQKEEYKRKRIKDNFAEDTVKGLIKDLENFVEQEKKESADKFEQAKNTFNEVNKK